MEKKKKDSFRYWADISACNVALRLKCQQVTNENLLSQY